MWNSFWHLARTKSITEKITLADIWHLRELTKTELDEWEVLAISDMHDALVAAVREKQTELPTLTTEAMDQMLGVTP